MNYFNLRHLDAFVTAIDSGSMAKAAAKLHMGQPALSQAIANLERLSGVKLLTRTTRSLLPTPAGEAFYKGAQRVLEHNARLVRDTHMWSSAQRGSVCVLSIPSIAQLLLPSVVKSFASAHQDVQIEVHDHSVPQLLAMLESGQGDFALVARNREHERLKSIALLKDTLRWFGSASHPLASRDKVGLRSLRGEQFIVMRRGAIRDLIDPVLRAIGPHLPLIEVDQQSTLVGMVSAGLGVSLLPSLSCQASGNARTTHKALAFGDHHRMIDVTRNPEHDLMPSAIAFFQSLITHLQAIAQHLGDGVQLQPLSALETARFLNDAAAQTP